MTAGKKVPSYLLGLYMNRNKILFLLSPWKGKAYVFAVTTSIALTETSRHEALRYEVKILLCHLFINHGPNLVQGKCSTLLALTKFGHICCPKHQLPLFPSCRCSYQFVLLFQYSGFESQVTSLWSQNLRVLMISFPSGLLRAIYFYPLLPDRGCKSHKSSSLPESPWQAIHHLLSNVVSISCGFPTTLLFQLPFVFI